MLTKFNLRRLWFDFVITDACLAQTRRGSIGEMGYFVLARERKTG